MIKLQAKIGHDRKDEVLDAAKAEVQAVKDSLSVEAEIIGADKEQVEEIGRAHV